MVNCSCPWRGDRRPPGHAVSRDDPSASNTPSSDRNADRSVGRMKRRSAGRSELELQRRRFGESGPARDRGPTHAEIRDLLVAESRVPSESGTRQGPSTQWTVGPVVAWIVRLCRLTHGLPITAHRGAGTGSAGAPTRRSNHRRRRPPRSPPASSSRRHPRQPAMPGPDLQDRELEGLAACLLGGPVGHGGTQ